MSTSSINALGPTRRDSTTKQQAVDPKPITIAASIDGGLLDPFDCLPVKANQAVHELSYWHFYSPLTDVAPQHKTGWQQAVDVNRGQDHWQLALESEAVFNTMLCNAAAKKASILGCEDDAAYYYYKAAALRNLRRQLAGEASHIEAALLTPPY